MSQSRHKICDYTTLQCALPRDLTGLYAKFDHDLSKSVTSMRYNTPTNTHRDTHTNQITYEQIQISFTFYLCFKQR